MNKKIYLILYTNIKKKKKRYTYYMCYTFLQDIKTADFKSLIIK